MGTGGTGGREGCLMMLTGIFMLCKREAKMKKLISAVILAAFLVTSGAAFAEPSTTPDQGTTKGKCHHKCCCHNKKCKEKKDEKKDATK
jgi:hypothetical protein